MCSKVWPFYVRGEGDRQIWHFNWYVKNVALCLSGTDNIDRLYMPETFNTGVFTNSCVKHIFYCYKS